MSEEAKRLNKALLDDPALAAAVKTILATGSSGEQVKAINALGYRIVPEDLRSPELEPVDDEEMEAVAGGMFFSGPEAADGHEIGCFFSAMWYVNQDEADQLCCPKSPDHKHDYVRQQSYVMVDQHGHEHNIYRLLDVCKYCGYEMLVE